jgi:hypothetical protein
MQGYLHPSLRFTTSEKSFKKDITTH